MAAIDAGTRRQRGLFGLLCGTISIKKSVLCIGDNSMPENEPTDRVSQPAANSQWQPEMEVAAPPSAIPSLVQSPVLVSKKLAEEAVAKRRNVRFRHHATVIEEEEEVNTDLENSVTAEADEKLLRDHIRQPTSESNAVNRRSRQKRMAPAPPLPGIA